MQRVGGLAVHAERRHGRDVHLSVRCDVSGLHTITVKPTALNSGLVVEGVRVTRQDRAMYLVVRTALQAEGRSSTCGPVDLANVPSGKYTVFYGEPRGLFGTSASAPIRLAEIDVDAP